MPDNTERSIVVHLTATLNFTPAQFAALLLREEAEKYPAIAAALEAQQSLFQPQPLYETTLATSAPEPPVEPVEPPAEPPANDAPPDPPPLAARSGRPPRANGKTPVKAEAKEPEPEPAKPLEESTVRATLRLFSTIMPGRDTAVVKLLEDVGGAPRLADCPEDKWPDIVAAAKLGIAKHAKPA